MFGFEKEIKKTLLGLLGYGEVGALLTAMALITCFSFSLLMSLIAEATRQFMREGVKFYIFARHILSFCPVFVVSVETFLDITMGIYEHND